MDQENASVKLINDDILTTTNQNLGKNVLF